MSRNVLAIDKLLKNGADIVTGSIYDPNISNKPITPLVFFIKRMRLGHVNWKLDEEILEVLKANEIKATSETDRLGLHKQLARMHATDVMKETHHHDKIIGKFLMPLLGEADLLSYRDNKGNTLLHNHLKTFQPGFTDSLFKSG